MSSKAYDTKWHKSISDIELLLTEEQKYLPRDDNNDPFFLGECDVTRTEALEYIISMYLKYICIFCDLEDCFDSIVHPQKREEIKETIVLVIGRVIYLRHNLAKGNYESSDPCTFSSDYISLSNHLRKLCILPHSIETPIPRFFKEDSEKIHAERNELLIGYTKMKLGVTSLPVEGIDTLDDTDIGDENKSHGTCNQRNDSAHILGDTITKIIGNKEENAIFIQRCFRAYSARLRKRARKEKEQLFIGMKNNTIHNDEFEQTLYDVYAKRKELQIQNVKEYVGALEDLKHVVRKEESYEMRSKLSDERIRWVTEEIAQSNLIPETLEKFYDEKRHDSEEVKQGYVKAIPKENEKKTDRSNTNEKKKMCAKSTDRVVIEIPANIVHALSDLVTRHNTSWKGGIKLNNFDCFSSELAKDLIVRDQIRNEVLTAVDETLVQNLGRIRDLSSNSKKGKRGKTGKKSRSSKNKKSKGVSNKEKLLPGIKILELKKMDTTQMLSILIEHNIINTPNDIKMKDLLGIDSGEGLQTNDDKKLGPLDLTMYHIRKVSLCKKVDLRRGHLCADTT